jgi:hypothetical protein
VLEESPDPAGDEAFDAADGFSFGFPSVMRRVM